MTKYKISRIISLLVVLILVLCGCQGNVNTGEKEVVADVTSLLSGGLEVHFIDVGQADSILIKMPNSKVSLIDGGNRDDGDMLINYLKNNNIKNIDYLIATHPHEDHIGGLPKIIHNFNVSKIYIPNKPATTKIFMSMMNEIKEKNIETITAKGGNIIYEDDGLSYNIIAPNSNKYDETNEYSVVTKLEYKNVSFIFTGDAEKDSEDEMVSKNYDLKADVLKVGHHGGRTSSNSNFLRAVRPQIAVISCGKGNDYGHPHKEALDRIKNSGAEIYRTDLLGNITVFTDGDKLYVNNKLQEGKDNNTQNNNDIQVQKVIGNKNSKIYHKQNAKHLPKEDNQMKFNSEKEAKQNGYKACSKCYK
ncbi:ComEC/Rec2 family competence protein [Abyssisolibacter fermentans]|uniref:ComEC/Rec2 family competence protein n=1 Tax=Abyssisolibacter fermentans TaxID=1766203 RepID=UPI000834ADC3|nr:ComEC/Rec2 family competence protein [Abyssisolibacter fermentans]